MTLSAPQNPRRLSWLAVLAAASLVAAGLATAWISDDAMITFRTVENLVHGDGMTWNVGLRAQTATHPLWVLLLAAARGLSGELFHTAIWLCLGMTAAAVFLVLRRAANGMALAAVAVLLLLSHAFVDYATCGLENALVYLLLAAFATVWFFAPPGPARLLRLALLGALLALARQDLALLVAPCLVLALRSVAARRWFRCLLPGTVLLLLWYGFALFYYGTAVPTPGYAKVLAVGLPLGDLARQGLYYLCDLGWRDPAMALCLCSAMVLAVFRRQALLLAPALGILLQLLFTLRVGGDFMSGRFFTAACMLAAAVLAQGLGRRSAWALLLTAVAGSALSGGPSWLEPVPGRERARTWHGIVDERAWYAQDFSLWSAHRIWPDPGAFGALLPPLRGERRAVDLATTAGARGLLAGPRVIEVEPWICDPLLVRLPIANPQRWRIGHFTRRLPEGYLESLASGEDRIRDAALREYWRALRTIVAAPLFDAERLGTLWRYWRGGYDGLLAGYVERDYRQPLRVEVAAASLPVPPPGQWWFDSDAIVVREGGLVVRFGGPQTGRMLSLWAVGNGTGRLLLLRGDELLASVRLQHAAHVAGAMQFAVPASAAGFDAVEVQLDDPGADPTATPGLFAVFAVTVH